MNDTLVFAWILIGGSVAAFYLSTRVDFEAEGYLLIISILLAVAAAVMLFRAVT